MPNVFAGDQTNFLALHLGRNSLVRPVTIEGQKFEIPERPSQTLPELSPIDPIK